MRYRYAIYAIYGLLQACLLFGISTPVQAQYYTGPQREKPLTERINDGAAKIREGIRATERRCHALTEGMQQGPFGRNRRWAEIVEQLQLNVHQGNAESKNLLLELATQAKVYNKNLPASQRIAAAVDRRLSPELIDLNAADLPVLVDSYFASKDNVCNVAWLHGQLNRFKRIQAVLAQTNPVLAGQIALELGPYLLQAEGQQ